MGREIIEMIEWSHLLDPLIEQQFQFPLQLFVQQPELAQELRLLATEILAKSFSKVHLFSAFNGLIGLIHCLHPSIDKFLI